MPIHVDLRAKVIDSGWLTKQEAKSFFVSLFEYSTKRCKELAPKYADFLPTRQYTGPGGFNDKPSGWKQGEPIGVCDHFTAGESAASTVAWFSSFDKWPIGDTKKYAGASSEFLVEIDGSPLCLIPFWEGKSAWHEPSLNGRCIGIEHVNVGWLQKRGDQFYWWYNQWKTPYRFAQSLPPIELETPWRGAQYMAPYTRQQLITNVVIKRALISMYPGMRPSFFVGHSDFRDDKKDPGPLFPQAELNQIAFEKAPLSSYALFNTYTPHSKAHLDAFDVMDMTALQQDLQDNGEIPLNMNFESIEDKIIWVQINLKKLGYTTPINGIVNNKYTLSVEQFQVDHGLEKDGVAGPLTRAKIAELVS
jgi:N-acetyl-anhydromuramyl-L-alanine amidase AmpD